jgi:hypothetical protein
VHSRWIIKLWILLLLVAISQHDLVRADTAMPPDSVVWVRMHGDSSKYVMSRISAAAIQQGMSCNLSEGPSRPILLCQFKDELFNAVITAGDEPDLVIIELFYSGSDSSGVDTSWEKTINAALHCFAGDVKRSGRVRAVIRCSRPLHIENLTANCDGESLWAQARGDN